MAFYRTTIARCLALAAIVGYSPLACKGGTYQDFKNALERDATGGANDVKAMIERKKIKIDSPIDRLKQTPLHIAAREGAVNTLQLLISRCRAADIDIANLKDRDGFTPLHLAVRCGSQVRRQVMVEMLMEVNPKLALVRNRKGYMALHLALENPVKEQAEEQAKTARDELVGYLLFRTVKNLTIVEKVVEVVTNFLLPKEIKEILEECTREEKKTLEKMLEARVLVVGMNRGYAAIHLAAKNGTLGAMLHILERGESMLDLDNLGTSDYTPLQLAAEGKQGAIVIELLKRGADHLKCNQESCNFLHYAAKCEHTAKKVIKTLSEPVLQQLLSKENKKGRTPLHEAVYHLHLEVVKLLVEQGADNNAKKGTYGFTPLDLLRKRRAETSDLSREEEAINNIEEYLLSKNAEFTSTVDRVRDFKKCVEDNLAELSERTTITHSVGPTGSTTTFAIRDPLFMFRRDPDASS